jgi:mannose-1-phosphate guanylyltransferase
MPLDEQGNIKLVENSYLSDSNDCLIIGENKISKMFAIVGVDNIVIVDTPDALLICKKSDTQKVKQIVDFLKNSGNQQFL